MKDMCAVRLYGGHKELAKLRSVIVQIDGLESNNWK